MECTQSQDANLKVTKKLQGNINQSVANFQLQRQELQTPKQVSTPSSQVITTDSALKKKLAVSVYHDEFGSYCASSQNKQPR
jgi:hypothetical protein